MTAQSSVTAQFQDDTTTFSANVASTCSFSNLESSYGLRNLVDFNDVPYLMSYAHSFYVTSNAAVKVAIQYSIIDEPAGFVPTSRWANLRQLVGSRYQTPAYQRTPNEVMAPMAITETPGTATVAIGMLAKPATLPGNYEYQMTITCLL